MKSYTYTFKTFAIAAIALLCAGCAKELAVISGEGGTGPLVKGEMESPVALESGLPIRATASEGLAPLTFLGTVSDQCIGEVYMTPGAAFPDLFFLSPFVTRGLSRGDMYGLNVCTFVGMSADGSPIYSTPQHINPADTPWETHLAFGANPPTVKVASFGGKIYGFELKQANSADNLARTMKFRAYEYDPSSLSFSKTSIAVTLGDIPHNAAGFTLTPTSANNLTVCILTHDGMETYKTDRDGDDESLYDGAGFYEGLMLGARVFTSNVILSGTTMTCDGLTEGSGAGRDLLLSATDITSVKDKASGLDGYVAVSKLGTAKYMTAKKLKTSFYMQDSEGADLNVPICCAEVITVHAPDLSGNCLGIIASGEGCKYWYKFTGKLDSNKAPIFESGRPIMMKSGELFCGSLCVPDVVDWDGDGANDIVVGNSEGRLLFFKNTGSDESPQFSGTPEYLESDGQQICFRSGYYEIQSPYESCWGYLCPTVFDWNGDGLLDVVFSHNEGKYEVMLGCGTKTEPKLGPRQSICLDGMELYGLWRVRPAAFRSGNEVYLATVDGDNAIHLYRRVSDTSVEDLGKALLKNGRNITGHKANLGKRLGGEQGRMKLEFADWDGDGVTDLLLGHASGGCVPYPEVGFPYSVGGTMQCMWLRNVGTNDKMVFDTPVLLGFRGINYNIGSHSNVPTICPLGPSDESGRPNLLIGTESGKMYFFKRSDVSELTQYNYLFQ
ncbi:MAG: VCBS repeat-containing protein [Bacteroidales bacterium]|nr:VCBS repeat-containing protein [Bacteroidales bacterium]